MANGSNQVEQRVHLDGRQYQEELKKLKNTASENMGQINKTMQQAGSANRDFTEFVKKNVISLSGSLKDLGGSFAKYLGKGAAIGGAAAGVSFLHTQMKQAISTGLDFGRELSHLASRADLPAAKVKKLRDELYQLGKTGASLQSLPAAVSELFGATGNIDQSMSVMNPIAKTAALGGGDASAVARFVKDRLQGEGREINQGNVGELLQSLVAAQRGGQFKNVDEAMEALGSGSASAKGRAGLSDRNYAALVSGATRVGADKETGVAAIQGLLHLSQSGLGGSAALAGLLGMGTGKGDFDFRKLNGQNAARFLGKTEGLGDSGRIKLLSSAGVSEQEATGLLAILKGIDKFQAGVKRVSSDQKTLDQSFEESTDNLEDGFKSMRNQMDKGFDQILSPFHGPLKKALKGDLGGAAMGLPGAGAESLKGIMDNKALVGMGLSLTALSGVLSNKIFGGLGGGAMKGKLMEKVAGTTPVYVVNAEEISGGGGMGSMVGGAASKAGTFARFGLPAIAAGVGMGAGKLVELEPRIEEAITNAFKKAFGKPDVAGVLPTPYGQKIKLEITSTDGRYNVTPKASDNPRNAKEP
jgi:hypothetical protein